MKKFLISTLAIVFMFASMVSITTAATTTFVDIQDSYAKDAIIELQAKGIINGMNDTNFDPKGTLTRAQFVTIIVKALGLEAKATKSAFTDVTDWAIPYVEAAAKAGVVEGVSNNSFAPNEHITREAAVTILVRSLKTKGKLDETSAINFTDADKISDWAKPFIAAALKYGLISGYPDGTFDPKGIANREMAAIMGKNLLAAIQKVTSVTQAPTTPEPTVTTPETTPTTPIGFIGGGGGRSRNNNGGVTPPTVPTVPTQEVPTVTDGKATFSNGTTVEGLPAGATIAAKVATVTAIQGIATAGQAMDFTFTGTMPTGGLQLSLPTTSDDAGLSYFNTDRNKWELQEGSSIVTVGSNKFVQATIHHFSIYGPIVKSAQLITDSITTIITPKKDATKLALPTVIGGYTIAIKSSDKPDVIALDGTITPPSVETTVALVLEVTKTSDGSKAVTVAFSIVVPAKSVVVPATDLTAYNAALVKVAETNYTSESWTVYQAVVKANVVTSVNTQSEVDAATANIIAAQNNLVLKQTPPVLSNIATVTSSVYYVVSSGGTANETITNVTYGTNKADFLTGLVKGEANQTWNVSGIHDPVVSGDKLVVTAQDGTKVTYTVTINGSPTVAVTGVTLDHPTLTMTVNAAPVTLVATVSPTNATNKAVTWFSSDASVASVVYGKVTPLTGGTTTITVTTIDGNYTANSVVTVNEVPTPDIIAPSAPVGLSATLEGTQAILTWTANQEVDLAGYNVYQGGTKLNSALLTVTGITYTVTGLTYGATYSFQVSAVDIAGNESAKSLSVSYTPTAPVANPETLLSNPSLTVYAENADREWTYNNQTYLPNTSFQVNVNFNSGTTTLDFKAAEVSVYNGNTLLTTHKAKSPLLTQSYNGLSDVFIIGELASMSDNSWEIGAYSSTLKPTKVKFTLTGQDGVLHIAEQTISDLVLPVASVNKLVSPSLVVYAPNVEKSWTTYAPNTAFQVNVNFAAGRTSSDFKSAVVSIYDGNTLLASDSATQGMLSGSHTGLTDVFGMGDATTSDSYWFYGGYPSNAKPTKAVFKLVDNSGTVHIVEAAYTPPVMAGVEAAQFVQAQDYSKGLDGYNLGFQLNLTNLNYNSIASITGNVYDGTTLIGQVVVDTPERIQKFATDDATYGGLDGQLSFDFHTDSYLDTTSGYGGDIPNHPTSYMIYTMALPENYNITDVPTSATIVVVTKSGSTITMNHTYAAIPPVAATLTTTGATGIHGTKVYQQFELAAGGQPISLASSNVYSMYVHKPNGTTTKLEPDADTSLWFNVQNEVGNYTYTIVAKSGTTYEATLQWAGTQIVEVRRTTNPPAMNGGIEYQEYLLIDSTGNEVNLHSYDTMYQIKNPLVGSAPVGGPYTAAGDSANILYLPTNKALGTYTWLVKNGNVWSEGTLTLVADFAAGQGTVGDPYEVATAVQLNNVRYHLSEHIKLTSDIELNVAPYNTGAGWLPIGDLTNKFQGSFKGNGFVVQNLFSNRTTEGVGLFAAIGETGTIDNVAIQGVNLTGAKSVGAVAGRIYQGGIVKNSSVITGQFRSVANTDIVRSDAYVGGLVGYNRGGTIENSSTSAVTINGDNRLGGLVGNNWGIIKNSHVTASVISGAFEVGGLTGLNNTDTTGAVTVPAVIENSYADATVTGSADDARVGGIAGENAALIKNSYAIGSVSGRNYVGGITSSNSGTIFNSYAANRFTFGPSIIGGVTGQNVLGGTVTSSYYDSTTTGQTDTGKGTSKTTAEMQTQGTFAGWDFTHIWTLPTGQYPQLQ